MEFLQILIAAAIVQYYRKHVPINNKRSERPIVKRLRIASLVNLGVLFLLTETTLLFSFSDLARLSLCATQTVIPTAIWAAMGWMLMGPLTLAVGLQALILWLKWLEGKQIERSEERVVRKRRFWPSFLRKRSLSMPNEHQKEKSEVQRLDV